MPADTDALCFVIQGGTTNSRGKPVIELAVVETLPRIEAGAPVDDALHLRAFHT